MAKGPIRFRARLFAAMAGKGWTFATMPKAASAKLPSRGRVAVAGTINGFRFSSSVFPDGEGSHSLMVNSKMREGAGAEAGDVAAFSITPATDVVKVTVPSDLRAALARSAKAKAAFAAITPKARKEWVDWVVGAKKAQTRARRVAGTVSRLAGGAKRPGD